MDRIARQEGETVTYFRREADWIAVSGLKGGRIFYRKAVLACSGKVWHHIEFEYPAALKRRMDPFVNRASYSIDHAENDSCGEPE
jgi:serine/threonine-protein kinase